jgi:hypothetical protein
MDDLTKKVIKYVVLSLLAIFFVCGSISILFIGSLSGIIGFPLFALLATLLILFIGWMVMKLDID